MPPKIRARPIQKLSFVARIASGLSFVAAIIVSGILSFFINALRQGYRPVPWPIVIVMVASCFNIVSVIFSAFIRCLAGNSPLLLGLTQLLVGIVWLISTVLLGRELNGHLGAKCPRSSDMGHDFSLVCHLYKALFAFSVTATILSLLVAFLDVKSWKQARATEYQPMGRNDGGIAGPRKTKRTAKLVDVMNGAFKTRNNKAQDGERGIMLKSVHTENMQRKDDMLLTGTEERHEPLRTYPSLSDMGPRQRVHISGHEGQFDRQETRYDPGSRML